MTLNSDEYQAGLYAYNKVDLANVTTGGTTDVSLQPVHPGQPDMCYIVFQIEVEEKQQPEEPSNVTFTALKLDVVGRLPGTGNNSIPVSVSTNGADFTDAGVIEGLTNASGSPVYGRDQALSLDLTEAVKSITDKTVYVKLKLNGGVKDQCALQTVKITGTVDGENKEFVNVDYTAMTLDSDEYQAGLYAYNKVDLANVTTGGTTDVSLQPVHPGQPDMCYIVFQIEVTEDTQPGPSTPPLGNSVSMGYSVNYAELADGSLDWQAEVYDTSAMKIFYDEGDSVTMLCPNAEANADKTGYVTYKVTGEEGSELGLVSVTMTGRVFNKDVSSEEFYLAVDCSLDDGATWNTVRTFTSVHTTGKKNQTYTAVLGNMTQSSVLVRVSMRSDFHDWVGLQSLKIAAPAFIAPGFTENFGEMRPGATSYQQSALCFDLTRVYASNDGYTSLTTDMSSTSQGRSYIDYLIVAEEGKTLDGLVVDMIGRIYDKTGDANRGIIFYYSDDYGVTFTEHDRIRAGAVTAYGQEMQMDLAEVTEGKSNVVIRLEINSKYWDWVSIETLQFSIADEDNEDSGQSGDEGNVDGDSTTQNPGTGEGEDDADNGNDDEWDDGNGTGDDEPSESPSTGDAFPSLFLVAGLTAGLMLVLLNKKKCA